MSIPVSTRTFSAILVGLFLILVSTTPKLYSNTNPETDQSADPNQIKLSALPEPLNSKASEFSPTFSADGQVVIFNKKGPGQRYSDLFISQHKDGRWSEPKAMVELNSPFSDESPYLSADGRTLFFSSDRDGSLEMPADSNGRIKVSYDLYWSRLQDGHWSPPKKVPGAVNSLHHERSPSFDSKRQVLFFSRWPFGDFSRATIMASRLENGSFSEPEALPASVNSGHREAGFVPADNGKGYYFASERAGGLGGWDIWFVAWQDGKYGQAVNMGPQINSKDNDIFLIVRQQHVYLCSNRPNGPGAYDIYSSFVGHYQQFQVVDKENGQAVQTDVQITDQHGISKTYHSNAQGELSVPIRDKKESRVHLSITSQAYLPYEKQFQLKNPYQEKKTIELEKIGENRSFTIHDIHFDYNSATIKADSLPLLKRLADYLKVQSELKLQIIGHTDRHGSESYNLKLSKDRAVAVRDYLVDQGLQKTRFNVSGAGFSQPLAKEETPEADRLNRRTEFKTIK